MVTVNSIEVSTSYEDLTPTATLRISFLKAFHVTQHLPGKTPGGEWSEEIHLSRRKMSITPLSKRLPIEFDCKVDKRDGRKVEKKIVQKKKVHSEEKKEIIFPHVFSGGVIIG
uniref:Uncharacterized protein n=1 Tax=Bracon brevicornis TaxID=1563983 RepID=A0A6V7KXC5_9HYME